MEGRKLYGSLHNSPATLKVVACLFEHDLDFEFIPVDLEAGENKQQQFLSISPFGQVPVFEDGGIRQFESRAIIRSMAHQHCGQLKLPIIYWDTKKQAVVSNWIDVEDHKFEPPALKLSHELFIKQEKGLTPDQKVVTQAEAALSKVLDVYEAQLSKFKYLASDDYTIADLIHLPNLQMLMAMPAKKLIESRPHVNAWCSEILARPAWIKVIQLQQTA